VDPSATNLGVHERHGLWRQGQWGSIEVGSSGDCPKEVTSMLECLDCRSAMQSDLRPESIDNKSHRRGGGWRWPQNSAAPSTAVLLSTTLRAPQIFVAPNSRPTM
jgi:hypothetical protein